MPTSRLIQFIESHGNPVVANADGTLTVTSEVVVNGHVVLEFDTIPATLAAARDLLGY